VWFDLPASDLADAMSFYQGLFGWEYRQMDRSPEPNYVMIEVDGELIGGLRKIPRTDSQTAGENPVIYFTVEELAAKIARARELGATIVGQMVQLGEDRGRYQWIRDREGNLIGLWAAS